MIPIGRLGIFISLVNKILRMRTGICMAADGGNVQVVHTAPYHGYQVLFSPYSPTKIAFTGAQNYGIQGNLSRVES